MNLLERRGEVPPAGRVLRERQIAVQVAPTVSPDVGILANLTTATHTCPIPLSSRRDAVITVPGT
jgi:hypothetical protein